MSRPLHFCKPLIALKFAHLVAFMPA